MVENVNSLNLKIDSANNNISKKQDASTAITTTNIGYQTVNNSNKCGGLPPSESNTNFVDSIFTRNKNLSNGHSGRLTGIGYDGVNPYLVIDGKKHHFNIID